MSYEISLEQKIGKLLSRHRENADKRIWEFYDYIPWERKADTAKQILLPQELVIALETSMLTEINLPWYTAFIKDLFKGGITPFKDFLNQWVGEEEQHSTALESYLITNGSSSGKRLNELKREILISGWDSDMTHPITVLAYTSIQELATVVFYRNVAATALQYDQALHKLLMQLSFDESLHYAFYNQAIATYLELDPDLIIHIVSTIKTFKMPGAVLSDFDERMKQIQSVGYGPDEYLYQVLDKIIKVWKIDKLTPKTTQGIKAKEEILTYIMKLKRISERLRARS